MLTPQATKNTSAREVLAQALAKGGEHIGDLTWPELRIGATKVERPELRTWLDEEGLPPEWAPEDPSGQKALGKALGRCAHLDAAPNVSIEREELRSRVALLRYSTGKGLAKQTTTWGRVQVGDLDELEIEWSDDPVVAAARSGATPSIVYTHVQAAFQALNVEYERAMNFVDAAELGEMVVRVVCDKLGALRIRRDGGLYYVPTSSADQLRRFARVIAKTGESALPFIPAFDTPDGRSNIGRGVSETLHAEIQNVVKSLAKLGSETKGPRESSLARRLTELEALTARAETCRIVLDGFSESIAEAINTARGQVLEMMELEG